MLNCKQTSELASRSIDDKLPFWESIALKMHLMLCHSCSNFTRQLHFLRKASSRYRTNPGFSLSDEARQRIANALKEQHSDSKFK